MSTEPTQDDYGRRLGALLPALRQQPAWTALADEQIEAIEASLGMPRESANDACRLALDQLREGISDKPLARALDQAKEIGRRVGRANERRDRGARRAARQARRRGE